MDGLLVLASLFLIPTETKGDLDFRYAVEEFAIAASHRSPIPKQEASLINAMGSKHYAIRRAATERLVRLSVPPNDRWLFWATKYRDAEIRMRANAILRRIHRCQDCFGSGLCDSFVDGPLVTPSGNKMCSRCGELNWVHKNEYYESYHGPSFCRKCGGLGSLWNRGQ